MPGCKCIVCASYNVAATVQCFCCRYTGLGPGGPPQGAALHQFGLYPTPTGPSQVALSQLERERLERLGEQSCCSCLLKYFISLSSQWFVVFVLLISSFFLNCIIGQIKRMPGRRDIHLLVKSP